MIAMKQTTPSKILVVTSCTKDKVLPAQISNHSLVPASQLWDNREDDRTLRDYGDLEPYRVPAAQLYHGLQHRELMQGVELLRRTFGQLCIEVSIISAGFGVVDEDQTLPPYEATFADQSPTNVRALSQRLRIPQRINEILRGTYDCAFFLLGDRYLSSLSLPFDADPSFPCLFLASPNDGDIPRRHPYVLIPAGRDEGIAFHYNMVGLKGHLFKLFAEQLVSPWTKNHVFQSCPTANARLESFLSTPTPQFFLSSIKPLPQNHRVVPPSDDLVVQQSLFPDVIVSPSGKRASNYGRPLRFFVPDWDDMVDPGYDFERDLPTEDRKRHVDEVYAHQIYKGASYDGLLFSKCTVEGGKAKHAQIREQGIHTYARFEKPIMGDCGAFSYITEDTPPYQTQEILDYYQSLGFDYGVSIDHLVVPAFYPVREYRYRLTRENAHEFIKLHRARNYTFVPVGVAQGWSPQTYRDAVVELLEWGYKYVALGGIARTQTSDIVEILEAVAPVLQSDVDLHLLGVARDREGDEMQRFRELGVTSFDSAAYLRRAWLSDTANYITPDGGRYTALRISPVHPSHPRVKKLVADGVATLEELRKVEQDALKALRAYGRGQLGLEEALGAIAQVSQANNADGDDRLMLYRRTLEEQPWKKCGCEICRHLGIEVLLFRGNDRNRRRGFHNVYVFYQRFQRLMEEGKRA